MSNAQSAAATRTHGPRSSVTLSGLAFGLTLLALTALAQVTPVFAGFAVEAPISVTVTGGELGEAAGLMPGDRITLTPIVIEARGGDMLYALHADVLGPDQLIRQVHATARTARGGACAPVKTTKVPAGQDCPPTIPDWIQPSRTASIASSVRDATLYPLNSVRRWPSTVFRLIPSSWDTSSFVRPRPMSPMPSSSRSLGRRTRSRTARMTSAPNR